MRPFLAPALLSEESWAGILHVAALLPAGLAEKLVFECPLAPGPAWADLSLCVAATGSGPAILAGSRPGPFRLPAELAAHPVWRRIRAFSRAWADPASCLYGAVHSVWLELDRPGAAALPVPSFFFGSDGLASEDLLRTALGLVLGDRLTPSRQRALLSCMNRLPAGANVFQVGAMLARAPAAARLCIEGLGAARVMPYLESLGGTLRGEALAAIVGGLAALVDDLCIALDVGDGVGPRLGLECFFASSRAPRLRQFLDVLVDHGLCGSEKRAALLAYPGFTRDREDAEALTWRTVSHLKVTHEEGAALTAKAYLSVKRSRLPAGQAWIVEPPA